MRSLLKWTGLLDVDLYKIIKTVLPIQWFSLCCYVWTEAKVGLISLQKELTEHLWTDGETSSLHNRATIHSHRRATGDQ